MARGRFISNAIMSDKKINELIDDTSRLAFTWLITEADAEGRVHGDPAMVRSLLFPRRSDITIEKMESYIREWHQSGLVRWYKANGDLWIWFPNFERYQVGLRKEREPASQIPPLESGELQPVMQQIGGELPANIRQTSGTNKAKLREDKAKLREGKVGADKPRTPPQITAYREVTQKYPKKALWVDICEVVKEDEQSIEFFKQVIKAAMSLGWYEGNITNLLEWVRRGEIPHKNGTGSTGNPMLDAIKEAQKDPNYGKR